MLINILITFPLKAAGRESEIGCYLKSKHTSIRPATPNGSSGFSLKYITKPPISTQFQHAIALAQYPSKCKNFYADNNLRELPLIKSFIFDDIYMVLFWGLFGLNAYLSFSSLQQIPSSPSLFMRTCFRMVLSLESRSAHLYSTFFRFHLGFKIFTFIDNPMGSSNPINPLETVFPVTSIA